MDTPAAAIWSDNEFMPLILVPEGVLEDGGHHVVDAEGGLLCHITGDQERAERFIATANSHDALVKALEQISEGDVPRPIGKRYRADGTASKHDQCMHGLWMYEDCGNCISEFARAVLVQNSQGSEAK